MPGGPSWGHSNYTQWETVLLLRMATIVFEQQSTQKQDKTLFLRMYSNFSYFVTKQHFLEDSSTFEKLPTL